MQVLLGAGGAGLLIFVTFVGLPGTAIDAKSRTNKAKKDVFNLPMGGYNRLMKTSEDILVSDTSGIMGPGRSMLQGTKRFVIYQQQIKDPKGRLVYIGESTEESEGSGQHTKTVSQIYFSYTPDGTRRIHGIKGPNAQQRAWVDNDDGFILDMPRTLSVGLRFRMHDYGMEFEVKEKEPVSVPAGEFLAFRCEGSGSKEVEPGVLLQIRTNLWISPQVGEIKALHRTSTEQNGVRAVSTYELEAVEITAGRSHYPTR